MCSFFDIILESDGSYDMSDEKVIDSMKSEIRARMQSLTMPTPKIASEFYTADEMVEMSRACHYCCSFSSIF
jgi:hypothetical protein